jgi:hypothetical protein
MIVNLMFGLFSCVLDKNYFSAAEKKANTLTNYHILISLATAKIKIMMMNPRLDENCYKEQNITKMSPSFDTMSDEIWVRAYSYT